MDQQDLTVQTLINIPAVRDALLKQKIDVANGLLRRRLAELDALQEIEAPLAKAAQVASDAREAFEKARKEMEVARGKLGNAEARLNEVRGRGLTIRKRLRELGDTEVTHAATRIGSLISYLQREQVRQAGLKSPDPRIAKRQTAHLGELAEKIRIAQAAATEVEKLRLARIGPLEVAQRAEELIREAGLALPEDQADD